MRPEQITAAALAHSGHFTAAASAPVTAGDATLQLEALLGQHSVLVADMMRGRLRGDPDFAQAANAALTKNTEALGGLIRALLGAAAQARFTSLWSVHVTALFNYARGLADHDTAVRRAAQSTLRGYESSLARFFAGAAHGRLPLASAESALRMHVNQLLHQADAYAAGDYAEANRAYRESYNHTYGLGKVLAAALLGPAKAAALDSPEWSLRSELARLLGEHVALVVAAMRSGVANLPDFAAAGAAVNGNTRDLAGAVDGLFGAAAAKQFQSLWADHVDALMAYTAGVVAKDAGRTGAALAKLGTFQRELAAFLGGATGRRLAVQALAKGLTGHDQMLVHQVDAFAAKDYQQAHDLAYSTYQQMSGLAGQLAEAFGATVASRMPQGGAQTGHGGMATVVGRR
jgi:hypothetical protein